MSMEAPVLIPNLSANRPADHRRRSADELSISHILHSNPHLPFPHLLQLHARLFRLHLHDDNILATKLVSANSTAVSYARRVFHSLPSPDLVVLNALLKAHLLNSLPQTTLLLFLHRPSHLHPDRFTFPYLLKACAEIRDSRVGAQLHGGIVKVGQDRFVFVMNSLADMYFKCGLGDNAIRVLGEVVDPDSSTWNILVSGLLGVGDLDGALEVFDGMPHRDVISWNIMLSAFLRAGKVEFSRRLFERMPARNVVSWNAMIAGYVQNNRSDDALSIFSMMDVEPDDSTMLSVAAACRSAEEVDENVVDRIALYASRANSVSVRTALLGLYGSVGRVGEARRMFDLIHEKDLVSWNAMIGAYSRNRMPSEAIELFMSMQREEGNVKPDCVTMASLVDSCSQLGALSLGEWIHGYIRKNTIKIDTVLATALVDMYSKCGDLDRATLLFSEHVKKDEKDVALWNAMINGFAVHGQGRKALSLFARMENDGNSPNELTFLSLLNACSHGGLVEKGLEVFGAMERRYGIAPKVEHYGCVVDLLGRACRLEEAYEFVLNMPMKPDAVIWGALLSACRSHQSLELAEVAAKKLIELEPQHDGSYVLLSNMYAHAGNWANVEKIRTRMKANNVNKEPGLSTIEFNGTIHEFRAGDKSHPMSAEIYKAWDGLVIVLKSVGYKPDTEVLLKNLDEEEKEEALYRHSEKLALSFALISTGSNSTIRIVKNLRICTDCHRAMELISLLKQRDIIVRDRNRFHHFSGGNCSCGGYW